MNTLNKFIEDISFFGNKTAFKFLKDDKIEEKSYLQFKDDTDCMASFLKHSYGKNIKMALLGSTSYEWLLTYFSITKSSNVVVTLDYSLDIKTLCEMINFADVEFLFMSVVFKPLSEEFKTNCPKLKNIFILETDLEDFLITNFNLIDENDEDDLAQIIFTSGTTSKSKAVMLSHKNLTSIHFYGVAKLNSSLTFMSVLPVHHVAELIDGIFYGLHAGGTICINDKIENLMTNIQLFKPNVMTIVPLIMNNFALIAKKILLEKKIPDGYLDNFSILERRKMFSEFNKKVLGGQFVCFVVGGSAMDSDNAKILEQVGIGCCQGYGLTETTAAITGNQFLFEDVYNCGPFCIKELEYKIIDNELLIKGPVVMKGYYKNEEETKKAFTEDNFFKTGDLAEVDEYGNFKIIGRKKDLIILDNGENVSPEELQSLVGKIPNANINIVYNNKNNLCCAIFIEKHDTNIENDIKAKIDNLNESLPNYKKITNVHFTTTPFVLTTKNSVKRKETIKNVLNEINSIKKHIAPRTETELKIYNKVKELTNVDNFSITDSIFSIGIDSLQACELATDLNINVQDIYRAITVENIAKIEPYINNSVDKEINDMINFNKNIQIDNINDNYFITGASGFLGSYILRELVKQNKNISVLIRSKEKFERVYKTYFNEDIPENINIYIGDVSCEFFGLSDTDYNNLVNNTKNIIHTAAIVKHIGNEEEFVKTNFIGTKHCINFALKCNAVLNYVSSYSVSGFKLTDFKNNNIVFDENILSIGQDYTQNVYVSTKYLSEKEILLARKRGLNANIFRIGSLTWDKYGTFQIDSDSNALFIKLNGLKQTEKYLENEENVFFDLTPVDECAKAFILLMQDNSVNNIYHLFNPNGINIDNISNYYNLDFKSLDKTGFKILAKETTNKLIKAYANYTLISHPSFNNKIDCSQTIKKLAKLNFLWSVIDKKYLDLIKIF